MSPAIQGGDPTPPSFPRVSGDEPALFTKALTEAAFSPRERG